MMKPIYLFILLIFPSFAFSEPSVSTEKRSETQTRNYGTFSSLNLGLRYSSIKQRRGVILYHDYQIDPIIGIFMFDDRLEFLGDSISYRDFVHKDILRLRTKVSSFSDNPLYPSYESRKAFDRPTTYEWNNSIEMFFPGYNENYIAEVDLSHSKDFVRHHGNFLELTGKLRLGSARILTKKLEPNLAASIGWGDAAHNQFLYGPSDKEGFSTLSYGIWFAFPEDADRKFPIIQFTRFMVLGDHRNAEYARGRDEGYLISLIGSYDFLKFFR